MQHSHLPVAKAVRSLVAAVLLAAFAAGPAFAGDPKAGREKAQQCQVCHGLDGLSKQPDAPSIAGDSAMYLEQQLKAFRSGARSNPRMSIVAEGLSDQDIADLAAYYSAIEVTAKVPKL